ncbi:MAG: GGDEF domain-containing protein [bacterium]|nr:GGDEF domain-containing protein [bacterium]
MSDSPEFRERALQGELESLRRRLAAVEAERDELARQNNELFIFQQVFSAINSSLDLDDILSMVMRGIREALGYSRLTLFDVVQGAVTPRMITTPDGLVVPAPSSEPLDLPPDSPLAAVAAGRHQLHVGEGPPPAPLSGGDGPFFLIPLNVRQTTLGVLFVDGSDRPGLTDDSLRILLDFASQAAMAIETAHLFQETKRLAMVDHLTGLANARHLHDLMEHELAMAARHAQPLSFVIMDLDDLKLINDSHGHAAGDAALRTFAETLKTTARASDIVARYAGDEFVLAMPQTDEEACRCALTRIMAALNARGIKVSAGVAIYPLHAQDEQSLFVAADVALYQSKVMGKNRFTVAPAIAHGEQESALG